MCEGNKKVMGKGERLGNQDGTRVCVQDEMSGNGFRDKKWGFAGDV